MASNGWMDGGDGNLSAAGTYGSAVLNTASGLLTYNLDNTAPATEALSDGEAASDSFTVASLGSESRLEQSTYVATFNITGTNDAAVITGDIDGTAIEAGGIANAETNTAQVSGDLYSSDVDGDDDTFNALGLISVEQSVGDSTYAGSHADSSSGNAYIQEVPAEQTAR